MDSNDLAAVDKAMPPIVVYVTRRHSNYSGLTAKDDI